MRHLGLIFLVLGCGGAADAPDATVPRDATPAPPGDGAAAVELELGTGQSAWMDLPATGGRTELIHGPQGGYHVFGRVRFRGFDPDVLLTFRVEPAEGGPALTTDESLGRMLRRGLVQTAAGYESSSPELVILTAIRGPTEVVGRMFNLSVSVRDRATDRVMTASRVVTIVDEDP